MTSPFGRYNSFEDPRLDEQLRNYDKRVRNLETGAVAPVNPNLKLVRYQPSGTENYNNTANAPFPGLAMEYNKLSALSYLHVEVRASGFATASHRVTFGVNIYDSFFFPFVTNYDVSQYFFNAANDHRFWAYARNVPDEIDLDLDPPLPKGEYNIEVILRVNTSQFNCNTDDLFNLLVSETPL